MRFLVIVRTAAERSFATMNCDTLSRAGVLLDAADLCPGAFDHNGRETSGVPMLGYWLIDVRAWEDAVEHVRRVPASACVVEVRRVADALDGRSPHRSGHVGDL